MTHTTVIIIKLHDANNLVKGFCDYIYIRTLNLAT